MKALLIPLLFISSLSSANQKIEIFTNDRFPVNTGNYQVDYYNLDDKERAYLGFPQDLPADPEQAKAAVSRFMQTPEFRQTTEKLKEAYEGYVIAQSYKLAKLPAIVIDEQYILYGLNDVHYAVRVHADYQRRVKK